MMSSEAQTSIAIPPLDLGGEDSTLPTIYTDISEYRAPIPTVDLISSAMAGLIEEAPHGVYSKTALMRNENEHTPRTDEDKAALGFLAMAGFCVSVKQVTDSPDNSPYLAKRWRTYCATSGKAEDPNIYQAALPAIKSFQKWISAKPDVRRAWFKALLVAEGRKHQGIIEQIKMVAHGFGMAAYALMMEFMSMPSKALANDHVYKQAKAFRQAYRSIEAKAGIAFPYSTALGIDLSELHQKKYPDLYCCVVSRALSDGKLGKAHQFRQSNVTTTISQRVLEELSAPLKNVSHLDKRILESRLAEFGHHIVEKRKRRDEDEQSEDTDDERASTSKRIK